MLLLPSPLLQWQIPIREYSATIFGAILQVLMRALKPIVTLVSWNVILRRRGRQECPLKAIVLCQLCIPSEKVLYTRAPSILEAHNYLQHFCVEREGVILRLLRLSRALLHKNIEIWGILPPTSEI